MSRVLASQLARHVGETVSVSGWLHRWRPMGGFGFLIVRDRSGLAQVVIDSPAVLDGVYAESVVCVEGEVVAEPKAPGGVEIHDVRVKVLSPAAEPPPFDLFRPELNAQLPTLLDHAAITLRHPKQRALFEIASASMEGFRSTLRRLDFTEIQTPKIVASATESGANVFKIDYFGRAAYLAQSPQFYKQMMVGVFERVFEVAPVFRAEPHDTPRHLNEYVSCDVEFGFIDSHRDVMTALVEVIRGMVAAVSDSAATACALWGIVLPRIPAKVPIVHFTDALDLIAAATGEDCRAEPDLSPHHERWLGEWALREYGSDFVFVEGYPMAKRPFYTHPDVQRPAYSASFDLLFRGLELVTGGQRLHLYADYLAALDARGMPVEPFEGYLEAFKFGLPPHGGFAIGLERWTARLAELPNVREAALFPRDVGRLTP
ncbi:MAG: aspartate--tRNA(Asn) ligase [Chloroflexi bacterium]|nr:aspartate--tRNA(Asn) ligase [Chloroflexota bacterium]